MHVKRPGVFRRIRKLSPPLAALAIALFMARSVSAYVIVLKDGRQITAKGKPDIQGTKLVFYTPIGALQTIPVIEFDEKATAAANSEGTGDAYVLGAQPGKKEPAPLKRPSLSEYIKVNKKNEIPEPVRKTPNTAESAVSEPAGAARPGIAEAVVPASDASLDNTFARALETSGIRSPRISAIKNGVRVQAVTENEDQVFGALKAIARGLKEARSSGKPVERAEIFLSTSGGESAGHFEMTPDDAEALLNGKISPAKYFVANVTL